MNFTFLLGTFARITTLSIVLVLPEDAQIVTIDFKDDWVATGRPISEKVRPLQCVVKKNQLFFSRWIGLTEMRAPAKIKYGKVWYMA